MTDEQNDLIDLFDGLDHEMLVEAIDRYLVRFGKAVVPLDPAIRCLRYCDDLDVRLRKIEALLR